MPQGSDPEFDDMLDALCGEPDVEPALFTQEWWSSVWGKRGKNYYNKSRHQGWPGSPNPYYPTPNLP